VEIQVKGWPAVILVALAVVGVVTYRAWLHGNPKVAAELRERLEFDLMTEIAGRISADAQGVSEALQRGDREGAERLAQGILERRVEVNEFDMRGGGDDIIVKTTFTVHGPEGSEQRVGYYRYSYSPLTGWHYRYETTAFSWWMRLL
jgi:hypothetical protein